MPLPPLKGGRALVDHPMVIAAVVGNDVRAPARTAGTRRWRVVAVRLAALGVGMLVLPNLAILALHLAAQRNAASPSVVLPIKNFAQVDDRLWRGAAPTPAGLEALTANGVTTVIDLRAEDNLDVDEALFTRLGLHRVHLPMRDGQAPTDAQVASFLAAVEGSEGRAFVHCGAGVGRTGTMSAAYLVKTGQATPSEALRRNLTVGPPSLEQLAFSAGLSENGAASRPGSLMVAISRTLDAPRRIWVNVRS
ncbi:MAG TPA: dual specificity protein phosphatase family protein [Acidimicrobiales bacterium]|nr:dual specificity protein phosphatase family protein [Acidimicrobiales bacterium]